jgi:hypothetical protein
MTTIEQEVTNNKLITELDGSLNKQLCEWEFTLNADRGFIFSMPCLDNENDKLLHKDKTEINYICKKIFYNIFRPDYTGLGAIYSLLSKCKFLGNIIDITQLDNIPYFREYEYEIINIIEMYSEYYTLQRMKKKKIQDQN